MKNQWISSCKKNGELQKLYKETKNDVEAKCKVKCGDITNVSFNGKMTSNGRTKKFTDGTYEIAINPAIRTEKDLKNVLAHELLHTTPDGMTHTGKWAERAEVMNKHGYNIKRLNNYEKARESGYTIECDVCGVTIVRKRKCALVEHPERYEHRGCGGTFRLVSKFNK